MPKSVLFNPKEGFWQDDQGYVYTDSEATLYDAAPGETSTLANDSGFYIPKGAIQHKEHEQFFEEILLPNILNSRKVMIESFFHREMEVEATFDYETDFVALKASFEGSDRKTLLRLSEQHTPVLAFKDDYDGFWFTTDDDIKAVVRAGL